MNIEFVWKIAIVVGAAILGSVSYMFYRGAHDNPVEELSERVIYVYTGADVDLTPDSPEIKATIEPPVLDIKPIEDSLSPAFDEYDMILTSNMGVNDGNE